MRQVNVLSTPILAQVGAALTGSDGPFAGLGVQHLLLVGPLADRWRRDRLRPDRPRRAAPLGRLARLRRLLSQRGSIAALRRVRRADRPGAERRRHLGPEPTGARGPRATGGTTATTRATATGSTSSPGVGHMGTRYPPYNDNAMWQNDPMGTAGQRPQGRGDEQPAPRRAVLHGPAPSCAVGGRRRGPAAGGPHRGGAGRALRQGRARQQPGRRPLRADGRPPVALPLQPRE